MPQGQKPTTSSTMIETACRTVELEAYGLAQLAKALADGLGRNFEKAIVLIEKALQEWEKAVILAAK